MRKLWLLSRAGLRKNRGQAVSFLMLILLSSILFNMGLVTARNYNKEFDRQAAEQNAADVMIAMQNTDNSYLGEYQRELLQDNATLELESFPIQYLSAKCKFSSAETTRKFALLNMEEEHEIGRFTFVEKTEEAAEHPIYLPYLFKTSGGYTLGDPFTLYVRTETGESAFDFTVAGFFDETFLGTINSTTTGLLLEKKEYSRLSEQLSGRMDGTMILVQLKDPTGDESYSTRHLPDSGRTALSDSVFFTVVKTARTVTSTIGSMIIVAFSMIIVVISLIVVKFRIGNSIEEDMQNIGALKAIGYTGAQIVVSIMLQFLTTAVVGCVFGIGISWLAMPLLSAMFAAQTGIVWKQSFDPASALITGFFVLTAVVAVSLICTHKARRLQPIEALRNGLATHSFKKNPFPLHRSRADLTVLLACKAFCRNAGQNCIVGLIVASISLAAVFAGVLYLNISLKFENFMVSTAGELFDIQLECAQPEKAREIALQVKEMEQVRKAYPTLTVTIQSEEGAQVICYAAENFAEYDNQNMIYTGRFPKYENEVAIGGILAKQLQKKPGDLITLTQGEEKAEYLITGLIQGSNFMGHDAAVTQDGYRRMAPHDTQSTIAVYLEDGADAEAFIEEVEERQGNLLSGAFDYRKMVEASMETYRDIVGILVFVIMAVTAAIIALTLYLVIKTTLLQKRRELGIQKAIGYTTIRLILQTALGILPVVLCGSAVGCAAGYFTINPILSFLFSGIGIMKVQYEIPISMLVGLGAGISIFGFLTSVAASVRIRKMTPYALVSE